MGTSGQAKGMERWRCLVGIPVVEEEKRVVKGKQAVCRAVGEFYL